MSNESSNAPMMSAGPTSIFQTWINALTRPNEQTYSDIAASPNAKATTAYLWVFITSILVNFITFIIEGATIRERLAQSGLGADRVGNGIVGVLVALICVAPILAVIQTVFFAIGVAIIQWIARMFNGKGTFDQMAYTFAAISVPYSLVSSVFILLSAIPFVGFCFRLILGLAGLYILVLEIMAVKGVNQFGWGPAIGSLLIPGVVIFLVICCITVAILSLMGPVIGNIFSTINQSLNP
jgi:Yip1 domain